jgi:NADH-quinone oxidoreductase subunit H
MDSVDVLIVVVKAVVAFAMWLVGTALLIWGERRLVSFMQSRIGPNRLGPLGLFQTLADGAKLFFKEDVTPSNVDKAVYLAAPFMSAVVALVTYAVIPFGGTFTVAGREVTLQVWDPNIGILWVLAMGSLGVYGIVLAGWASGSKYPLLGGVRSSAQMVSYELSMSLGVAAVFVFAGSLRASDIVANQSASLFGFLPAWHLFLQFPAFALFFLGAVAETQRPPFDLPEAEGELVAGFHTEYSGAKFAMFFLAEFMNVITMSAVTVTLFLGGPNGPLFGLDGTFAGALLGMLYFLIKVLCFIFVFVWLRATLPRLRYDRLMALGWKVLLPLGLVWVMATGSIVVLQQTVERGTIIRVALIAAALFVVIFFLAPLFARLPRARGGGGGGGGGGPGRTTPGGDGAGGRALEAKRAADERTPEQVGV